MKQINSKTVEISQAVEPIFYALSDFRNLALMQNDKVQNMQCTYDTCSFNVNGMADIALRIKERKPFEYITIASDNEIMGGFSFFLNFIFEKTGERSCNLSAEATIDGNAITLMMLKKQIQNGLDMLMDGIKKGIEAQNI